MKKDAVLTLLGGLTIFLLFKQYGKKKPCGCGDKAKVEPESEDDKACQEAVDMILAERTKTMRLTPEGLAKMRAEELEKCKNA